jgi:hypothetical protein
MKKNSRKAVFLRNSVMYAIELMQSADTLQVEKLFTACLQRIKKRTKPFGRKKKKTEKFVPIKKTKNRFVPAVAATEKDDVLFFEKQEAWNRRFHCNRVFC